MQSETETETDKMVVINAFFDDAAGQTPIELDEWFYEMWD